MNDDPDNVVRTPPSCVECRRRKSKCDRSQPCRNCSRFGRLCSYEKISRTPLTRKHLTDVEDELARTRARLRQYERVVRAGEQNEEQPTTPRDAESNGNAILSSNGFLTSPSSSSEPFVAGRTSDESVVANQGSAKERENANDLRQQPSDGQGGAAPNSSSQVFSLETPPVSGDFDWDERVNTSRNSRFIDGMASLTDRSTFGYMGVASGAALLRLAHDLSGEGGIDAEENGQDDHAPAGYTPPIPPTLFSFAQLEPFVDLYFQTYHISYPIVHEATFRAQFMEIVPRPRGSAWQVLLHIIAALGAFTGSEVAPEVDIALFEAAKARMSVDMLETGNITLVQALTLISNYVQKRNKPNSGYNYLGLAKRMAMGLGLHKEFPIWHSKPLMLEMRRRIWWSIYVFDVGAVITFSRPLDMPEDGIEVGLPLNVSDSDITLSTSKPPSETEATTLYTHVRCQSKFHLATSKIYTRIISSRFPPAEEMLKMDDSCLGKWLSETPAFFQESAPQAPKFQLSHAILKWRWRNFRILMYRPYLMRRFMTKGRAWDGRNPSLGADQIEEQVIQRCLDAAAESISLITAYWRHGKQNVMACWYGLYFLFQAILIPVICLRNEPYYPIAAGWRDQILAALETISDMIRLNSAASRCHAVVMKLCGAYLAQDMNQWGSPVQESPQTQLNALYSFMWPITDPQFVTGQDLAFQESTSYDFLNQITNL